MGAAVSEVDSKKHKEVVSWLLYCLWKTTDYAVPTTGVTVKVLIIGSSGHARVVADILLLDERILPLGYVSGDALPGDGTLLGLRVLGNDDAVADIEHDGVVIALGDNRLRKRLFDRFDGEGETLVSAIHPSAVIAPDAVIEPGCMVCAGAVVNTGCRIRTNTILNTGCTVDHDCTVGPHAHVAPGVNLAGNVRVGEGAFMGIGSCAVQGTTVGEWSTVGAGSAVIRDVEPRTTVAGTPARTLAADKTEE